MKFNRQIILQVKTSGSTEQILYSKYTLVLCQQQLPPGHWHLLPQRLRVVLHRELCSLVQFCSPRPNRTGKLVRGNELVLFPTCKKNGSGDWEMRLVEIGNETSYGMGNGNEAPPIF